MCDFAFSMCRPITIRKFWPLHAMLHNVVERLAHWSFDSKTLYLYHGLFHDERLLSTLQMSHVVKMHPSFNWTFCMSVSVLLYVPKNQGRPTLLMTSKYSSQN